MTGDSTTRPRSVALFFAILMFSAGAFGVVASGLSVSQNSASGAVAPPTPAAATVPVIPPSNSELAAPTISANPVVVQGETSILTMPLPASGTPPYSWQWLYSTNVGVSFSPASLAQCAQPTGSHGPPGSTVRCVFATSTTTAPGYYFFELKVTDSASTPETVISPASSAVTVQRAPAISSHALLNSRGDRDSGGGVAPENPSRTSNATPGEVRDIPTNSPSGLSASTQVPGGPAREQPVLGGSDTANCTVCALTWFSPAIAAGRGSLLILVVTDDGETGSPLNASFISDSSGSTWALNSSRAWNGSGNNQSIFTAVDAATGADTVSFSPGFSTAAVSATAILFAVSNVDEAVPIDRMGSFASGASTTPVGSVTTSVADDMVVGVLSTAAGTTVTATSGFTVVAEKSDGVATLTYVEEETVGPSASYSSSPTLSGTAPAWGLVAIGFAEPLAAGSPTPSAPTVDAGQSVVLTANPVGGAAPYSLQWYSGSGSGGCSLGTPLGAAATQSTGPLSAGTAAFCYTVNDGISGTGNSSWDVVTVNPALSVAAPSPSSQSVDQGQTATLTGTAPSSGTAPYTYQWLEEAPGAGSFSDAGACTAPTTLTCSFATSGSTTTGVYQFELQVTDSSVLPSVATSTTAFVGVNTTLTAPSAPIITQDQRVDQGQTSILTATVSTSGTAPYSWQWLYSTNGGSSYGAASTSQCSVPSGTGATAGAVETCSFATTASTPTGDYLFEFKVTDSATTPTHATSLASAPVTVEAALATASAPTVQAPAVDQGQTPVVAADTLPSTLGGSGTVSYEWLVSYNGGAFAPATSTQCAVPSGTATNSLVIDCTLGASAAQGTYAFEIFLNDSASSQETTTSLPSGTATVSGALATAGAPSVVTAVADRGQTVTAVSVTLPGTLGGTAPVDYAWLVSLNGGGYAAATAAQCATPSGTASNGALVSCVLGATIAVGSYTFELQLRDSATAPSVTTSPASAIVTVNPALATPATPSVLVPVLDEGQTPSLVDVTLPASLGGTSPIAYSWYVSLNGSGYVAATSSQCVTPSGAASAGLLVSCVAPATLAVGSYTFKLQLTDSASAPSTTDSAGSGTVTVNSALAVAPPTPSSQTIDQGQTSTISDSAPTTGSSPYTYQWFEKAPGAGSYSTASNCALPTTLTCSFVSTGSTPTGTYLFKLQVTDSATSPTVLNSTPVSVVVNSALVVAAPTPSTQTVDQGESATLAGTAPTTGTSPYSYQWMEKAPGAGSYTPATNCVAPTSLTCSFATTASTTTGGYSFELRVTDSAESPAVVASSAVTVTVNTALVVATPSPTAQTVDQGQPASMTGAAPTTGTSSYSYQWLEEAPGASSFTDAVDCAAPTSLSCAFATTTSTPTGLFHFELQVTDSATTPSIVDSAAVSVQVDSALGAPGSPTVATPVDSGQTETVTASIASVTGTGSGTISYGLVYKTSVGGSYLPTGATCTPLGSTVSCAYAPAVGTYYYAVTATDTATTPVTTYSAASAVVTVNSALVVGAPSPASQVVDQGQTASISAAAPTTGTAPYSYQWLEKAPGAGSYSAATNCAAPTSLTCGFATTSATTVGAYGFELRVTDSAASAVSVTSPAVAVTVNTALVVAAPTPSAQTVDGGQTATLTGTAPTTGTGPYTYQWVEEAPGAGSYTNAVNCAAPTTLVCAFATTGSTAIGAYSFKLQVTDSATTPSTATSAAVGVTVESTLTVAAPTPSSQTVDQTQTASLSDTAPTTGTSPYSYQWLEKAPGAGSYSNAVNCAAPTTLTCSFVTTGSTTTGAYGFELQVTDSATTHAIIDSTSVTVTVNSALAAAAPTPSTQSVDLGQSFSISDTAPTAGTSPYAYQWLEEAPGASSYSDAVNCAAATTLTCAYTTSGATATGTYSFELQVTDSASVHAVVTTSAVTVLVSSALVVAAPVPSSQTIDQGQTASLTDSAPTTGTGPYSYQWLEEAPGAGSYSAAVNCAASTTLTCSFASTGATATGSYSFKLRVHDSATSPSFVNSSLVSVVVDSGLTAPSAPTIATNPVVDLGQTATLTVALPTTGTAPYAWAWLYSTNGGSSYSAATSSQCATPSGSGGASGVTETCSFVTSGSTATGSYLFELRVTDTATTPVIVTSPSSSGVTVDSALTPAAAPTPSVSSLDADQPLTVTDALPTTGTATYSWRWMYSANGGTYTGTNFCALNGGSGRTGGSTVTCFVSGNHLTASTTYTFKLKVTDNASTPVNVTSAASTPVVTSNALTAGTPTPTTPVLDQGQSVTLTANPSGGDNAWYSFEWMSGTSPSTCNVPIPNSNSSTYLADPTVTTYYCYNVTDAAANTQLSGLATVTVNSALVAPLAPTVSATALDADQSLTVSATLPSSGTAPYSWIWLAEVDGAGGYENATECASFNGTGGSPSSVESCVIAGGSLASGDSYTFELFVIDNATTAENATSAASPAVGVRAALVAPEAPSVSATELDVNQALSVTASLPTTGTGSYSWQWLVSVNGGAFLAASLCAVPSGTGGAAGAVVSCTAAGGSLTVPDRYVFELQVTDSASTPEIVVSPASGSVLVSSQLTSPPVPTVSATRLDVDQVLTVTGTLPSAGSLPLEWQWLLSANGAAYTDASACSSPSGTGGAYGEQVTCTVPSGALGSDGTYTFELTVTDGATSPVALTSGASAAVVTASPLAAGSLAPASPTIDAGQSVTLTANPSGGTVGYTFQWYSAASASACTALANPISGATSASYTASPTSTTYYCYAVADSATSAETAVSAPTAVTVSPALLPPTAPTVSSTSISSSQGLTITGTIPTTGTPTYSWQWMISTNGGAFADATQCATNRGAGAAGGATETCSIAAGVLTSGNTYAFELVATDSATTPASATSGASPVVTVAALPAAGFNWFWIYVLLAVVVLVAIVAVLLARRRRTVVVTSAPIAEWDEGPEPAPSSPSAAAPPVTPAPLPLPRPTRPLPRSSPPPAAAAPSAPSAAAPSSPPPAKPTASAPEPVMPEPIPGAQEPLPEIDALMAELDRISGDISKQPPTPAKKGSKAKPAPDTSSPTDEPSE